MPVDITLESIIEKIDDKDFFYLNEIDLKIEIDVKTALFLQGVIDDNEILDDLSPFRDVKNFYDRLITQDDIIEKYHLNQNQAQIFKEFAANYFEINKPVLDPKFLNLTQEQLIKLNEQATNIDFALKLFLKPKDDNENFYTICERNKLHLLNAPVWRKLLFKEFAININNNVPNDRQDFFEALKDYLLFQFNSVKASQQAVEELKALTYEKALFSLQAEEEKIPYYYSATPQTYYMSNSKLANSLSKHNANEEYKLNLTKTRKKAILTACLKPEIIGSSKPITEFDLAVLDGISTQIIELQKREQPFEMTLATIARAMTHENKDIKFDNELLKSIENSVEKMRTTLIYAQGETITDDNQIQHITIDDMLLSFKGITIRTGDKIVKGYHFYRFPIIYSYSHLTGQVLTVPPELLSIPIPKNERNIALQRYLRQQIFAMKHNRALSREMLFNTIFKSTDILQEGIELTKDQLYDRRNLVLSILKEYKNEKFIFDYQIIKSGRLIRGVKILLSDPSKPKKNAKK